MLKDVATSQAGYPVIADFHAKADCEIWREARRAHGKRRGERQLEKEGLLGSRTGLLAASLKKSDNFQYLRAEQSDLSGKRADPAWKQPIQKASHPPL